MNDVLIILASTITLASPLILAALGGFASERAGVINIALEGNMLMGACVTGLVGTATGNAWAGLGAGIVAAVVMSILHWLLTQSFNVDHIVSGMAVNALAFGGTNFLSRTFTDPESNAQVPQLPLWSYYAVAFLAPVVVALYVRRTRGGLRLLAVGSDPDKSRQMGVFPERVRLVGLMATGVFCGLAGALIVSNAKYFTDNMTAGRGFIALAALIIGGWRPIPAALAAIVFGFFEALRVRLQGTELFGLDIPSELWNALPYVVTVIALAGFLGKSRSPAGLGKA